MTQPNQVFCMLNNPRLLFESRECGVNTFFDDYRNDEIGNRRPGLQHANKLIMLGGHYCFFKEFLLDKDMVTEINMTT